MCWHKIFFAVEKRIYISKLIFHVNAFIISVWVRIEFNYKSKMFINSIMWIGSARRWSAWTRDANNAFTSRLVEIAIDLKMLSVHKYFIISSLYHLHSNRFIKFRWRQYVHINETGWWKYGWCKWRNFLALNMMSVEYDCWCFIFVTFSKIADEWV